MARHARQHPTTKIEWATMDPQEQAMQVARATGGVAKQAKLLGATVWCVQRNGITTVFMFPDTGLKIGLCMYRWCPRKRSECSYHTGRPM